MHLMESFRITIDKIKIRKVREHVKKKLAFLAENTSKALTLPPSLPVSGIKTDLSNFFRHIYVFENSFTENGFKKILFSGKLETGKGTKITRP